VGARTTELWAWARARVRERGRGGARGCERGPERRRRGANEGASEGADRVTTGERAEGGYNGWWGVVEKVGRLKRIIWGKVS
jgi:hypothetical protein